MNNKIKGLIGSISLSNDYTLFMQYCERLSHEIKTDLEMLFEEFTSIKEEDLISLNNDMGQYIRNEYRLWEADLKNHPDDVSMAVIYYVHYTLNDGVPLKLSELRDAKIGYEVECRMDISELSEEDKEKIHMAKTTVSNMYVLDEILKGVNNECRK